MDTYSIEVGGFNFTVIYERDDFSGVPWEMSEGHGVVTDWLSRDKKAGELVLSKDGIYRRFYDFTETMKIAKREAWGSSDCLPTDTKGEQAYKAVMSDYEFLKAWCSDQWEYVIVTVTMDIDPAIAASCGLIETWKNYHESFALETAKDLIRQYERKLADQRETAILSYEIKKGAKWENIGRIDRPIW